MEYVEWLNRAGMSTRGNRSDLKEKVLNYRAYGVTVDNDVGVYIKTVFKMIVSLQCLVSNVMASSMDNERIETIENMIKVFLSEFYEVDK